jgi:hypothetical protein
MKKIKELLSKLIAWCKLAWGKVVAFLEKYGKWIFHLINLVVVGMAYYAFPDSLLVGGWFFLLLGYYIFLKILWTQI